MAHIISGAAGSGKTTALYSLLKTDKGNKILLVPISLCLRVSAG